MFQSIGFGSWRYWGRTTFFYMRRLKIVYLKLTSPFGRQIQKVAEIMTHFNGRNQEICSSEFYEPFRTFSQLSVCLTALTGFNARALKSPPIIVWRAINQLIIFNVPRLEWRIRTAQQILRRTNNCLCVHVMCVRLFFYFILFIFLLLSSFDFRGVNQFVHDIKQQMHLRCTECFYADFCLEAFKQIGRCYFYWIINLVE